METIKLLSESNIQLFLKLHNIFKYLLSYSTMLKHYREATFVLGKIFFRQKVWKEETAHIVKDWFQGEKMLIIQKFGKKVFSISHNL